MAPLDIPRTYSAALEHHQAGRLSHAAALYRQVLATQPDHAGALHHLGVVALQMGHHSLAVEQISRAIALDADNPTAHCNLGAAFSAQGRFAEAASAYAEALRLKPDYAEARLNLGLAQGGQGQLEQALASFQHALVLRPGWVQALHNLGTILSRQHRFEEAIVVYRQAIQQEPTFAPTHHQLGIALAGVRSLEEAAGSYRAALAIEPRFLESQLNLGNVLSSLGQTEAAVAAYHRAIEIAPGCAEAHSSLGNALKSLGRFDDAVASHRQALALKPDFAMARNNLGTALSDRGNYDDAIMEYRHALALAPNCAEIHYNLGATLSRKHCLDEALEEYHRALAIDPQYGEAFINLGNALKDQGRLDEALSAYRQAHRFSPEQAWMHSNIICSLHYLPTTNNQAMAAEYREWNDRYGHSSITLPPQTIPRDSRKRLCIGYISPDFRDHVIARSLLPLFRNHHREQFKIICYSSTGRPDAVTEEIRRHVDEWRDIARLSDDEAAKMIQTDKVDILVDLAQHLAGNRLPMLVRRPAPVLASFAAYPESAGVEAIRYRLSDRYLEAASGNLSVHNSGGITEKVLLLDSFWCYSSMDSETTINDLPAVRNGIVTFGSLNNFCKINQSVLRLWAAVLKQVPASRLILLAAAGSHRASTCEFMEGEGVKGARLQFVEPCSRPDYLNLYHRLDIALDPFPYGGHTTSLDALWMGLPVVSLAGTRAVSRAGLSQLSNLGLPEFVAFSEPQYVDIAAKLARDLPNLTTLRRTLRERMKTSPLMDASRFSAGIEAAYQTMWRDCAASSG